MSDKYTLEFPNDLTFNKVSRLSKARKIYAVLSDFKGKTNKLNCLDLGSSTGLITGYLGTKFGRVVGIDVDAVAIKSADSLNKNKRVSFKLFNGTKIPFRGNSFDAIVFNQVYEHADNPEALIREIYRVLKPGGSCYFGIRNKYFIFDGHYKIPFVSIMPKKMADLLIKIFYHKPAYDINLFSYWKLSRLSNKFVRHDYTLKVMMNPKKYYLGNMIPTTVGFNQALTLIARLVYPFLPNYIWILEK